jgi:hypothetical protein
MIMRVIALVLIIILTTGIVSGAESAAESTQLLPGEGFAPSEILMYRYPIVENNTTIMEYIRECGVGSWYEDQINAEYKSVHISPANSCGKQLVFSVRKYIERDDPAQIANIWILGVNETWSVPPEYPEYPSGSSGIEDKPVETQKSPGFDILCTIGAITSGFAFARVRRRR